MNATRAALDLDDTEALIVADHDGLLRAVSMAGAQVRSTAAAVDEGALDELRTGDRPRSVIWVSGRGAAESAGAMLSATLGGSAAEPIVTAAEAPPWVGPLDVLIVAGDDAGDPSLTAATAIGVRRGARVVVAAPFEGPLRDAGAGRVAVLAPRLGVPDEFALSRYLAAGLATLHAVDPAIRADLPALADELDGEALRDSAAREVFTNAAKALAQRISSGNVVLAGDSAATLALARHLSGILLRVGHRGVAAVGLSDALVALHSGAGLGSALSDVDALFHDEQFDGPLPDRLRVLALTLAAERAQLSARVERFTEVDVVGAEDVPDAATDAVAVGSPEQQLALLALRIEMAAVYLRLGE